MPLDTHAAFRELENGGFDAKQAEVLVQVINGAMGAQATKADVEGVKADIGGVKADLKEFREEFKAALEKQGDEFKAALEKQGDEFRAALEKQGDEFRAALEKQGKDFEERFASKTDVAVATNRNLLGTLAVAAVLFSALQLFS